MGKRLSVIYLLVVSLLAIGSLFFGNPNQITLNGYSDPMPPSLSHPFGTDDLGRDVALRLIDGARISLSVSMIAMGVSLSIGVAVGLCAGFMGGIVDAILMRLVDFLMGLPTLFLVLIIQVILGPSLLNVMLVIGATSWMGIARITRGELLSIRERPYILAARSRGLSSWTIAIRHALPNALPPLIVAGILGIASAILNESVLSFLGLGVQPPQASWGSLLQNSTEYLLTAPWLAIAPGVAITLTVMALNFLGDELRKRW